MRCGDDATSVTELLKGNGKEIGMFGGLNLVEVPWECKGLEGLEDAGFDLEVVDDEDGDGDVNGS